MNGDGRTSVRAALGPVLRHARGPGRLLPERHAGAAVPAADRSQLLDVAVVGAAFQTRSPGVPAAPTSRRASSSSAGARSSPRRSCSTTTCRCSSNVARSRRPRSGLRRHRARANLPIFMEINPTTPRARRRRRGRARACYPAFGLVRPSSGRGEVVGTTRCRPARRVRQWSGLTASRPTPGATPSTTSRASTSAARRGRCCRCRSRSRRRGRRSSAALAREKGDALFDARHRVVVSADYVLPAFAGSRRASCATPSAAGQLNAIVQAQTGFALTVTESVDVALHVADQPAERRLRSERGRRADGGAVVRHELLLAPDAGGQRRPDRRRGTRHRARAGLRAHRPVAGAPHFDLPRQQRVELRVEAFNLFDQDRLRQPGPQHRHADRSA